MQKDQRFRLRMNQFVHFCCVVVVLTFFLGNYDVFTFALP